jgi:hypothetical protein
LSPGTLVLFGDWTILRMYPPLRQAWAWRGQQAVVPISGSNAKRVLFGAIALGSGHRVLLRRRQAGQGDFQALLRELCRRYCRRPLALLLDKASAHTAPASQALASRLNISFFWLPKQASELNGMDQLWKGMKNAISANRQYDSIDQHARQAEKWIMDLSPAEARRKAGFRAKNFWLRHL